MFVLVNKKKLFYNLKLKHLKLDYKFIKSFLKALSFAHDA